MPDFQPRGGLALALAAIALLLTAVPGDAAVIRYTAVLSGSQATPRNTSPGTGTVQVDIDEEARTMRIVVDFQDLLGTVTAAHLHGPTATPGSGSAPVITPRPAIAGFPLEVTAGGYDAVFDLTAASTYDPDYVLSAGGTVAAAEALLKQALAEGRVLFNLHTSLYVSGEIAGFFGTGTVPATGTTWGAVQSSYR